MTTLCDFTKIKGWGRADNKKYPRELFASTLNTHRFKSNPQCHSNQLNPSQASLFDLLPT